MKKLALGLAALSLIGATSISSATAAEKSHWGYAGEHGVAADWGKVSEADLACVEGAKQSPINIASYVNEDLADLDLSYADTPLHVFNNGHTIQVNYEAGSKLMVEGAEYELLQFHFHTPSEHYVDGAPYPMEVHFVHKSAAGTLAVVGVMFKVGAANATIQSIWGNIPAAGEENAPENIQISAANLLPENLDYYAYDGSLTTPPCSEGVKWHVVKDAIEMSPEQLTAFQALFPVNARPIQPLHGRVIKAD